MAPTDTTTNPTPETPCESRRHPIPQSWVDNGGSHVDHERGVWFYAVEVCIEVFAGEGDDEETVDIFVRYATADGARGAQRRYEGTRDEHDDVLPTMVVEGHPERFLVAVKAPTNKSGQPSSLYLADCGVKPEDAETVRALHDTDRD